MTSETRPLPMGGDKATARSIAAIHFPRPRTHRCITCGETYPCRAKTEAQRVLES